MKFFISLVLLIEGINSYGQLPVDGAFNKCLKAVINIEVRSIDQNFNSFLNQQWDQRKISEGRWHELQDSMKKSRSKLGTAIFVKDGGKHFLLTARHVIIDAYIQKKEDSNIIAPSIMLIENDTILNPPVDPIYVNEHYTERMLWMYNPYSWAYNTKAYILSSISDDLAILCLDCDTVSLKFCNTLISRGYEPLETRDIDTAFRIKNGDNIYSIGFPENSIVGQLNYPGHLYSQMRTSIVSVPVITFGVFLGEYPNKSNFFDSKMFVYHGFSGAPVMSRNKLIGLVSGGEIDELTLTGEKIPFKYLIHNHSKFIKSSTIYMLLKDLQHKIKFLPLDPAKRKRVHN